MRGATVVFSSVVLLMLISMMSETKGIRMKRDMQDEQEEKMQEKKMQEKHDEEMHELEHHEGIMQYLIGGIGALEARVIQEQAEKKTLKYEHEKASNYTATVEEGSEQEQKKEESFDQDRQERIVSTKAQERSKNPIQQYVDNSQTRVRVSVGLGQYGGGIELITLYSVLCTLYL